MGEYPGAVAPERVGDQQFGLEPAVEPRSARVAKLAQGFAHGLMSLRFGQSEQFNPGSGVCSSFVNRTSRTGTMQVLNLQHFER